MDPVASLRPVEVDVQLGQWEYTVPALDAAEWIEVLVDGGTWAIVPGLLAPEDRVSVMRDYVGGRVTGEEMVTAAHHVLEAAGGRRWWEVERLVQAAIGENWPTIHGKMLLTGMRFDGMPLGAFINAVWALALSSCQKESERSALEWEVTKPPPGYLEEAEETGEAEFEAMMAGQGRLTSG